MENYIEDCNMVTEDTRYSLSILDSAFEASSDGILIVNCEGKVVKFNKRFIEMWSIPDTVSCLMEDGEFIRCVAPQLSNPEQFIKQVEKIYTGSEVVESIIEFKNGKVFESFSMPQKIDDIIVGRVWSFRDITNKTRRERELKNSEEKYFKAFMLSPDAIVITLLTDGKFVSVNKGFIEISGYSKEECLNTSSLEMLIWNDEQERNLVVKKLSCNGTIIDQETVFRTKQGKRICLLSASIIELNKVKHVLSVVKDITEKVQDKVYREILNKTLVLLNSQNNIKSSLKSIVTCIKIIGNFDAVGIRIESNKDFPFFVNEGFTEEFLSTENSLIEYGSIMCLDESGNPMLECICGKVISENISFWTNDSKSLNMVINKPRLKCVEIGYSSIAIIPIKMDNKVVGLIHLTSLEKNKFNESIIQYLEILASYIGMALDRNKDKEDKFELELKLWNTQRMDSIGMLASGIANDLNNIFFPILGISELLLNEAENIVERDSLKQIIDLTEKGSSLIKQIQEFGSKSNNKKMIISPKVIVEKALSMIKSTLPKNITIITDIEQCDNIYADSTQIYQVIVNLLLNASQAIKSSGTITVSLKQTVFENKPFPNHYLSPGRYTLLKIVDNGVGIPKENLSKIFDPFFTTKQVGTGLGLSVVHGIVKEHSGDIRVFSEEGTTSFNIYLPNIKRIMVVDDETPVLSVVQTILEKNGFFVTCFEDSDVALKVFKENPTNFDLIITDLYMPKINGNELVQEVQAISNIPIIICTGYAIEDYIEELKKINVSILIKPISLNDLVIKVNEVLGGKK